VSFRSVLAVVVIIILPTLAVGCGDNRPLSQVAVEDFGEHALVTGSTLFFNEPATLIFTFRDKWELFSTEKQVLFMEDTGEVWERKVESTDIDVSETKVQYEDKNGDVIAIYSPDSGLEILKTPEPVPEVLEPIEEDPDATEDSE